MKIRDIGSIETYPAFLLLGVPAVILGIIAATLRIGQAMNDDLSIAQDVLKSSSLLIISIAALTGLVLVRMYTEMKTARHLARTDDLTGLINRREFNRLLQIQLDESDRTESNLALLAMDLDRFKLINDTYGHEAGDFVIKNFGKRIESVLRENDIVCRISGDEFFVLLTKINDPKYIKTISNRILAAMEEPFNYKGRYISGSVSIGSARIPVEIKDPNAAMSMADFALLRSKEQGRSRLVEFDPQMAEAIKVRGRMEIGLRDAIRNKTLETRYHPIVRNNTEEIVGVEALVRWHNKGEEVPPSQFLELATELNLIHEIGNFVLERACEEIGPFENFKLAVNISKKQFMQNDFVTNLLSILERNNFAPSRLELEIPQTLLSMNSIEVSEKLEILRTKGVLIALGDFGTGYSNMMFLKEFKLDRIKLDHSFMQKMAVQSDGDQMVSNMIALGNTLSKNVTVEGIETETQFQKLKLDDCDEFQGFFFSKPLSMPELVSKTCSQDLHKLAEHMDGPDLDPLDEKRRA